MPDYIAWCHNHTVEKRFKKQKGISREYMQEKQKFLIELQWYLFKLDTISLWRTLYDRDLCLIEIPPENEYLAKI